MLQPEQRTIEVIGVIVLPPRFILQQAKVFLCSGTPNMAITHGLLGCVSIWSWHARELDDLISHQRSSLHSESSMR